MSNNRWKLSFMMFLDIFVWGTEGRHGLTEGGNNPETVAYFARERARNRQNYPLLAGIGITAGENMKSA